MPRLNTGAATTPDDVDVLVDGTDVNADGDAGDNDEPNTGAVNGELPNTAGACADSGG